MLNKKASKYNSFWWIVPFVIVVIVFPGAIIWYYSSNFDTRDLESEIISNKIYTCISEEGFLVEDFFSKSFSIFDYCNLNKEVLEKSGSYFIKISFFSKEEVFDEKKFGDYSFEKICNQMEKGVIFLDKENAECFSFSNPILYYNSSENLENLEVKVLIAIKGDKGGFVL